MLYDQDASAAFALFLNPPPISGKHSPMSLAIVSDAAARHKKVPISLYGEWWKYKKCLVYRVLFGRKYLGVYPAHSVSKD